MNRNKRVSIDKGQLVNRIAQLELFRGVARGTLERLAEHVQLLQVPRNGVLLEYGQCVNEVYAVISGSLKLYLLSCNGQQRVIRLLMEGSSFGEELLINQTPSPIYAEALSSSQVAVIPAPYLFDLVSGERVVAMNIIQILSHKVQQLMQDLEICCLQSALQRIAQYLCTLAAHCSGGDRQMELPASKVVVASLLNLTPETLSRGFNQLSEAGHVRIDRRSIEILDLKGLKAVAAGD